AALLAACRAMKQTDVALDAGNYQGFHMRIKFDSFYKEFSVSLKHESVHTTKLGMDILGNITRINNLLESLPQKLEEAEKRLETVKGQLESAKEEVGKPFPKEAELNQKLKRLSELNALLNMDEKENMEFTGKESTEIDSKENVSISKSKPSIHERLAAMKQKQQESSTKVNKEKKKTVSLD
ncbi:MAG: helicase, partial [Eubacteriales bacterium]|nr:helicase [Eubacteriales bacterium]